MGEVEEPREPVHERDVAHQQRIDSRPLHLDGDAAAVVQDGAMDLTDGGAAQRLGLEGREDVLASRRARRDDLRDVGEGNGVTRLESEELNAVRLGQQVETQREG